MSAAWTLDPPPGGGGPKGRRGEPAHRLIGLLRRLCRHLPAPEKDFVRRWRVLLAVLAAAGCLAAAADPTERLADPVGEARARTLFREVRCLVCQNESIDDSQAELAHDLRQIVRAQVSQGRSDAEIRAFLVARYGEFVLLKPPFSAGNALLWLTPVAALLVGGGLMVAILRRRPAATSPEELTADETRRLQGLLNDK